MKHSTYTSYDELPLMLSVAEVAAVLGISRAGAYELVHGNEFPALKIGSRIVVPKDSPPPDGEGVLHLVVGNCINKTKYIKLRTSVPAA